MPGDLVKVSNSAFHFHGLFLFSYFPRPAALDCEHCTETLSRTKDAVENKTVTRLKTIAYEEIPYVALRWTLEYQSATTTPILKKTCYLLLPLKKKLLRDILFLLTGKVESGSK